MEIGIPKERSSGSRIPEHRVPLTPAGVRELALAGAKLYVETGAGAKAGFDDEAYRRAGATVVYDPEEVYRRAELVLAVGRPSEQAWKVLGSDAIVMGFLHLAAAPKALVRGLLDRRVTAIGLEVIQRDDGVLPVLQVMSEIAGRLAPQFAGQLLESPRGPGVLLSGAPGNPTGGRRDRRRGNARAVGGARVPRREDPGLRARPIARPARARRSDPRRQSRDGARDERQPRQVQRLRRRARRRGARRRASARRSSSRATWSGA